MSGTLGDLGDLLTAGSATEVASDWLKVEGDFAGDVGMPKVAAVANAGSNAFKRSIGDYTLIAVGIILAIGALLISQRPTAIKVAGTVSNVAKKGAAAAYLAA